MANPKQIYVLVVGLAIISISYVDTRAPTIVDDDTMSTYATAHYAIEANTVATIDHTAIAGEGISIPSNPLKFGEPVNDYGANFRPAPSTRCNGPPASS